MAKSVELLDALWRYAWEIAPADDASSFLDELLKLQREAFKRIAAGALTSTRGTQWAIGAGPDISPTDIQGVTTDAVRLYYRIATDLGSTDEEAIYNSGLNDRIAPVTSFRPDFSCRRY